MTLEGQFYGKPFVFLDANTNAGGGKIRLNKFSRVESTVDAFEPLRIKKFKIGCCIVFSKDDKGQVSAFLCHKYLNKRNIKGVGKNLKAELVDSKVGDVLQRQLNDLLADESEDEDSDLNPGSILQTGLLVSQKTNTDDRSDNTRIARAKQKRDDQLCERNRIRDLTNPGGALGKNAATQMNKPDIHTQKAGNSGKRKHDASSTDFGALKVANKSDVACQQQEESPVLSSNLREVVPEASTFVCWLFRIVNAFKNKVFFLNLDTWTTSLVTLPDSENIFMSERGVFSLCYEDRNPELIETSPIDSSVDFPYASTIFVPSKYLTLAGLPEPCKIRFETRGSWLIYEITGDDLRDQNTKNLFQKVATTGTVVPVKFGGEVIYFNLKLVRTQTRITQPAHKVGNFELVCSRTLLTDTPHNYRNNSLSYSTGPPPKKKRVSPPKEEKFEVVDGPILPLVNGKSYILIPQISSAHKPPQPGEARAVYNKFTTACNNILWVKGNGHHIIATFINDDKAESRDGALLASQHFLGNRIWGEAEFHSREEIRVFNYQDQ